ARASLGVQGQATYGSRDSRAHEHLDVYFLVPCLNEDAVIGQTVSALTLLDGTTTLVIDDGSDDDTARCAEEAGGDRVRVLRRGRASGCRARRPTGRATRGRTSTWMSTSSSPASTRTP